MNTIPCGHLVEHAEGGKCMIGRSFPNECCGCAAYIPGLTEQERQRCEVWSRVMGYHRPTSAYNASKAQEHRDRQFFQESRVSV